MKPAYARSAAPLRRIRGRLSQAMTVAILRLVLFIGNSTSLKTKRMVLHSFKTRLRNKFNIAVSEIDDTDKWQKATLAIVGVGRNKRYMDGQFGRIINFAGSFSQAEITDYEMEMI